MPPKGRQSRSARRQVKEDQDEERQGSPEEDEGTASQGPSAVVRDFLANWRDQPLEVAASSKLKAVTSDWRAVDESISKVFTILMESAAMMEEMAEAGEDKEDAKLIDALDEAARHLIDTKVEVGIQKSTIEGIQAAVARREQVDDAMERYEQAVAEGLDAYNNKSNKQKYAKDEKYIAFRQAIWDAKQPEDPMPLITKFLPRDEGDVNDEDSDDDDIIAGGVKKSYTCPLTLTPLEKPVTSKICHHSYSGEPIRNYIRAVKNGVVPKCPFTGCAQKLTLQDLEEDKDLERKVKAFARRQKRREEEEEEDEVNHSMVLDD